MRKFISTLKDVDPIVPVIATLTFAAGLLVGQQTTSREVKKHYIVDASEVEVVYRDPYKKLALDECVTDWECETAQLIADKQEGKLVHIDDPNFYPDTTPVIEPIDCEPGDIECEEANKQHAGKPAY